MRVGWQTSPNQRAALEWTTSDTTLTISSSEMLLSSTALSIMTSLIKSGMYLVASVPIVSLVALYFFQRKLVYPSSINNARDLVDTPDKHGIPYEPINIKTEDGERLQSYLMLHDPKDPNYKNKTVLVLSPNAGNIGQFLPIVKHIYSNLNYNVFIYSYRGYGLSTGTPSETGLKKDADAVMRFIETHPQLSQSSVVTYGRSLGGAVAIYITAKYGKQISGMILENTFLNIPKVIPHIFPFLKYVSFMCTEYWDSENDIKHINPDIPCLFLSGSKDEIVPPEHMAVLYETVGEAHGSDRKIVKVWAEFDAHHNDTIVAPGYWDTWEQFMIEMVIPYGK